MRTQSYSLMKTAYVAEWEKIMQIGNITNSGYVYQTNRNKQRPLIKDEIFSPAVTKADEKGEGEFLGLTMLPEEGETTVYGMNASLLEESTPDNPIVQIISNLDGKTEIYKIEINKVDPENASRMEIFALCSYADKCGMGTGSTFGSFHTFKMYEETAKQNGYMKQVNIDIPVWDQFRNEKLNWVEISEKVLEVLKNINDPKIFDLFSKGKKLLNLYSKYTKEK